MIYVSRLCFAYYFRTYGNGALLGIQEYALGALGSVYVEFVQVGRVFSLVLLLSLQLLGLILVHFGSDRLLQIFGLDFGHNLRFRVFAQVFPLVNVHIRHFRLRHRLSLVHAATRRLRHLPLRHRIHNVSVLLSSASLG